MSDVDFDQLMCRLREKVGTAPQMVQAMVELTYGCNLRCVHCYNPTHEARNELTSHPQVGRLVSASFYGRFPCSLHLQLGEGPLDDDRLPEPGNKMNI